MPTLVTITYLTSENYTTFPVVITSSDVTTALGYTPYNETNPSGFITITALTPYLTSAIASATYQPIGSYLTTISGLDISLLNNNSGFITSSALIPYLTSDIAAATYQVKGNYLTTISGLDISLLNNNSGFITSASLSGYLTSADAALTYYPLTNPSSFISGITSGMVTTALGFTPYDASNPNGFITSTALTPYLTSVTAAATYQIKGNYLTTISGLDISLLNNNSGYLTSADLSSYLTTVEAAATYYPLTNPSGFITSSALTPYLTSVTAAATYQVRGDYLTTISGLNISQLNNDSGYITSSALSPYLTSALASTTYQPIGSYLTTISGLDISLLNNNSGFITSSDLSGYAPLSSPDFTTDISTPIVKGVNGLLQIGSVDDRTSNIIGDLQDWNTNYYQGDVLSSEVSSSALNFGQLCYRDRFGKWSLASANVASNQSYNMLGICLTTVGAADETISILTKGYVATSYFSTGGIGDPLYMDAITPGSITDTAPSASGNVVRIVGNVFWNSNLQTNGKWILSFSPDNTWIELT